MIPISDRNPVLRTPIVTYVLLAAIAAVWLIVQRGWDFSDAGFYALSASVCNFGLVPGELTGAAPLGQAIPIAPGMACVIDNLAINALTPVTSMFLHGSWGHIIGNGLFLGVFGNNVEDVMGRGRFLLFYLMCGLAAAAAHVLVTPASPIPTVGASGAISGVLGAYLVLFPRVRVNMLFIFIIIFRIIPIPAWLVLAYWFILQIVMGLPELSAADRELTGGVAVWAHVGGFVAGMVLVKLFENRDLSRQRRALLSATPVPHAG